MNMVARLALCCALTLTSTPSTAADSADLDLLTRAITIASKARPTKRKGAQQLADASAALAAIGARPLDGTADLSREWHQQAVASGKVVAPPPTRGRVLGPTYRAITVGPGKAFATDQLFLAGQWAEVRIAPTAVGGTSLSVVDAAGKPVCPPQTGKRAVCRWLPPFSARYNIRTANDSRAESRFYLLTN